MDALRATLGASSSVDESSAASALASPSPLASPTAASTNAASPAPAPKRSSTTSVSSPPLAATVIGTVQALLSSVKLGDEPAQPADPLLVCYEARRERLQAAVDAAVGAVRRHAAWMDREMRFR